MTSQFLLCASLMIFSTVCMGAAMPVASQIYSNKLKVLGRSIGNVYSVNTLGAIAGSLVAGFVLVPLLGTERTILAGLFVNAAMAALILSAPGANAGRTWRNGRRSRCWSLATLSMRGGMFWSSECARPRHTRLRPVFRSASGTHGQRKLSGHRRRVLQGRQQRHDLRPKGEDYVGLRTNGKVDASNKADMITQLMIGYLPDSLSPCAALHDDHRLRRRRHGRRDNRISRKSRKSTVWRSRRPSSARARSSRSSTGRAMRTRR